MDFKTIILDFDGTIVESVGIKDRAFRVLFEEYSDHLDEIMEYHLSHNATIRFDKFKHITENILCKEYTEEMKKDLSERFSDFVFKNIVECPYVDGAMDFLEHFYGKIPLYLVSASPDQELTKILEKRQLDKYFKNVYPISWIKKDAIHDILSVENILPYEAVFVGDTFEDYSSAKETGVLFIARDSKKTFNGEKVLLYKDLFEVKDHIVTMTVPKS